MFEFNPPQINEVPEKLAGTEIKQPRCEECGFSRAGHMIEVQTGCVGLSEDGYYLCKFCASDLGYWDKDDIDEEVYLSNYVIALVMEESAYDRNPYPKRQRCFDGRICYCAPFEDEPPRYVFNEVSGYYEYDPDEIVSIERTGPIRRRYEDH